jgi:EF hand domain-containing protein
MNALRKVWLPLGAAMWQVVLASSLNAQTPAPVEDSAALFNSFDNNGDGFLSAAEIGSFPWGRYDFNGDGNVSRSEFLAGRAADRGQAAVETNLDKAFALLDWNGDGYLSGTELDGKWSRFDADGNGRVTKEEFKAGRTAELMPTPPAPVTPPTPVTPVTPPSADGWTTIRDAARGFSFQMPGQPKTDSDGDYSLEIDNGDTVYRLSIGQGQGDLESSAAERLKAIRDKEAETIGGKLTSDKEIALNGHPGLAFLVEKSGDGDIAAHYRVYVVADRIYEMLVVTDAASPAGPATINRFFNSLQLTAQNPSEPVDPKFEASFGLFLNAVEYTDAKLLLKMSHPELRKMLDEPVVQLLLDTIKSDLGTMTEEKLTDVNETALEGGGTQTKALVHFERGDARCTASIQGGQLVAFDIDSDKLKDLDAQFYATLMQDPKKYGKTFVDYYEPRCERLLKLILAGSDQDAYAMFPEFFQKQIPLAQAQEKFQSTRATNGALKSIDYDGYTVELNDSGNPQKVTVNFKLTCENGDATAGVSLQVAGMQALITGFEVTKKTANDGSAPQP